MGHEKNTLDRIHSAAEKEFLEKGFLGASLRQIVKEAGVTTGAFYGYYGSKEALFDALVGRQYTEFLDHYRQMVGKFKRLSPDEQRKEVTSAMQKRMLWMFNYVYDHKGTFQLILKGSEGTKYENLIYDFVEIGLDVTHCYADAVKQLGKDVKKLDRELDHILMSGLCYSFFEMIIHDVPRAKGELYILSLQEFYLAGWKQIMGIEC